MEWGGGRTLAYRHTLCTTVYAWFLVSRLWRMVYWFMFFAGRGKKLLVSFKIFRGVSFGARPWVRYCCFCIQHALDSQLDRKRARDTVSKGAVIISCFLSNALDWSLDLENTLSTVMHLARVCGPSHRSVSRSPSYRVCAHFVILYFTK